MNDDHEWRWQRQVPATEDVRAAGMPAALSAMSKSRATSNDIPPHHGYGHPNVARVDHQNPISLGYPIQQVECEQFMGNAPILAPQPTGAADAECWVLNNDQGIVGMQRNDLWFGVPFDVPGAFGLEISGGSSSGGSGVYMDGGYVGRMDESGLSPWTPSTEAAGEYGAQAPFLPGYTHGTQSDHFTYGPQASAHIELNGGGGEFKFCHIRG